MDVKTSAVRGVAWTSMSFGIRTGFQLLVGILVARQLAPGDYGVYAIATLTIAVFGFLRNAGIESAIVRTPEIDERHLSSAFWFKGAVGLLASGAMAASAPFVADLFNEPGLVLPLLLLAPTFFLSTVTGVHAALLSRQRDYKRLALRETTASTLGGVVAIALAFLGFGVYALVAQNIASALFSILFLWTSVPWRPRAVFDWPALRGLLDFGLPLAGTGIVVYVSRHLDNVLIGRFLGAEDLGLYTFAYAIVQLPVSMVQSILGRVMYPELARLQGDLPKVREVYVGTLRYAASLLWLPLGGLLALAPLAVPAIYGDHWTPSVPLLQIFCLVAFGQVLATTVGWIYQSQGHTRRQFWTGLAFSVAIVLGFVVGLRWGILGVTLAYAAVNYLLGYPSNQLAYSLIGLRVTTVLRSLWRLMVALAHLVAVTYLVRVAGVQWLPGHPWVVLVAAAAVGTFAYLLTVSLLEPRLASRMRALPRLMRGARKAPAERSPLEAAGAADPPAPPGAF
jgi:O-antigen/teichoic acid export membrane protein